jgi:hypothetical protein
MDHRVLDQLNWYLDQCNSEVIKKLKIKLILYLNDHEEEFFNTILGEYRESYIKTLPFFQEISYYSITGGTNFTMHLGYTPNDYISITYPPKNFSMPLSTVLIKHDRLSKFPKFTDIYVQCITIKYFENRLQELKNFISVECTEKNYSLLRLLRIYPELYRYVNKYFHFKTRPLHRRARMLPENLSEYIRKVEFMSQL